MDLQLRGKRALVTGSSSGIGEATAKALAREGVEVVVHGRREGEAQRVAREITSSGGRAAVVLGDLTTDEGAAHVGAAARSAFGGIDILVNNAGAYNERAWLDTTAAEWNDMFNQNVASMVRMVRSLVPDMRERHWGRVVAIASAVATMPFPMMSAYSVSKAANVNLAVSLAKDLAGTGVTSNAVSPGPILTPGLEKFVRDIAKKQGWPDDWTVLEQRFVKEFTPNPTGRIGRVEDIADAVTFLVSPRASYINGANIRVDGGTVPSVN
jgi:NAD(P)-dependent dehydrogenase (short-subunit alcohol dehydrogenase family)